MSFDYFNFLSKIVAIQFNCLAAELDVAFGLDVDEIKIETPLLPAEGSVKQEVEVITIDDDSNPDEDDSSEFALIILRFLLSVCSKPY